MDIGNYYLKAGEKPLDTMLSDAGFTSIFRTIGCIGDSLSSGEFESTDETGTKKGYHDYYEYSWGQYIARTAGCKVYNFSKGGMSAKTYMQKFADEKGFWDPSLACQAYILALGVNDLLNQKQPLGDVGDIDLSDYTRNADTFCGWYAGIIQRYKQIQPHARFFLMTMPRGDVRGKDEIRRAHAELLYQLADLFDYTYVLDFYKYAPVYDEEFIKKFYLGGHLNAAGYLLTAKMVMSYIDYIIRSDFESFSQVGFIGKDVHNYTAKW
ncbi:MAG: SGNH/GDSL hydrolase family protein [Clostridia bacterium]|nr:SGNH/GDSL hydrolase family protein [Clostridia bacterium]